MPAGMEHDAVENVRFNPSVLDVVRIERRVENLLAKRVANWLTNSPNGH